MMRLPGRLHITWENDNTLHIDTDTGTQTRRFHFDAARQANQPGKDVRRRTGNLDRAANAAPAPGI